MSHITAIVDLQFGSTGKGLIAGYLSQKNDYDLVVSANMPNAGHTFVDSAGRAWVNKVLPSGVYSPSLKVIAIGPGAVFDPQQLIKELGELEARGITQPKLVIHPCAGLLMDGHKQAEQQSLSSISSTMQGSMEAMVHKMRRPMSDVSNLAMHNKDILGPLFQAVAAYDEWFNIVGSSQNILMEGSQGYSLGINAGFYPYCTSRDCTVWRLIADCGMFVTDQLKVIGSARLHPIRVGNTATGFSGPCYSDQQELTWEQLGQTPERTTVTQRIRRVFTFSQKQIREAIIANRVDEVFLNFCNYDNREAFKVAGYINSLREEMDAIRGVPDFIRPVGSLVKYMGFGPQAEDVLEVL